MNNEGTIVTRIIEEEMRHAYIDYSMSVIVARALPDVRDGLKPVHRRVLYSMSELGLLHNRPYKKSARIVGECFVKGTLVSTPNGLIPIENLQIEDKVYTHRGIHKVTELYEMPKQPLLTITADNGLQNICTKGQMFKVFDENMAFQWKKADELQVGDYLVLKSVYPEITEYQTRGELIIDEDMAYLMGVFLSDGWIDRDKERGYDRMAFCSDKTEILDKISAIIYNKFGVEAKIHAKDNHFYVKINNHALNEKLINTLNIRDKYAKNVAIPEYILQSPENVIHSFLSGYIDGDGYVHKDRNVINITSISETFIRQLQVLLLSLDIPSSIYANNAKVKEWEGKTFNSGECFSLEIMGIAFKKIAEKLSLQHPQRKANLYAGEVLAAGYEKIPFLGKKIITEFSDKHIGGGWYIGKDNQKVRAGLKNANGTKIRYSQNLADNFEVYKSTLTNIGILNKMEVINSNYLENVNDILAHNVSFVQIKDIRQEISDITYDIQVENDHEFIANGVISHNCLGKYHPHGDSAVYETMVRMAQPWSLRYPLVDGQGNFGSVDGDNPAAMRYTEARLRKIAESILEDLEKNTVEFRGNFDDSLQEPTVLPSRIPNLLVNGASGIAVGMATNMAPHNLGEVIDATIAYIDNKEISILELCRYVKAPDFPTGATIYGVEGIKEAYHTGRGRVVIRANAEIVTLPNEREQIIITEIPYQVNKATTIKKIDQLINEKKIEGIADINDESDRDGMRIVVDIKRDASANVVLNQLYQLTPLQSSFSINNVALVKGRPMTLNLKDLIRYYVEHRHEIVVRRTQYDLEEASKRAHILQGLLIALDHLDQVIGIIRGSRTPDEAQAGLMENFELSEVQSKAILEMRLQRLTGLERDKIQDQYREIMSKIDYYRSILADEGLRMEIIKTELLEVKAAYGDKRRTQIEMAEGDINFEDLIENEDVIVTISHQGYIKRTSSDEYRVQGRGGTGFKGAGTKAEDFVEYIFNSKTHNYLLIFTEKGRCFWLKVYAIPKGDRTHKGRAIQNLIQIPPDDKIKAFVTVETLDNKEFIESHSIVMVTRRGTVKKTSLEAYSRPRVNGINAINIVEGDELIEAKLTNGTSEIMIGVRSGRVVRFKEAGVRDMGRNATGVRGISLDNEVDEVIGMVIIDDPANVNLMVVSEKGYGKRTRLVDSDGEDVYRITARGGKGVRTINVTEKTGKLIAIKQVDDSQDIMIITKNGITIRMGASAINTTGRNTQGVRLIRLREGDEIAAVTCVVKEETPEAVESEDIINEPIPLEEGETLLVEELDNEVIEEEIVEEEIIDENEE